MSTTGEATVIPLDELRKLLGKDAPATEWELAVIRDWLYLLAEEVVDSAVEERRVRRSAAEGSP